MLDEWRWVWREFVFDGLIFIAVAACFVVPFYRPARRERLEAIEQALITPE